MILVVVCQLAQIMHVANVGLVECVEDRWDWQSHAVADACLEKTSSLFLHSLLYREEENWLSISVLRFHLEKIAELPLFPFSLSLSFFQRKIKRTSLQRCVWNLSDSHSDALIHYITRLRPYSIYVAVHDLSASLSYFLKLFFPSAKLCFVTSSCMSIKGVVEEEEGDHIILPGR